MRVLMTREEFETYIRPRKDFNSVVTATEFNDCDQSTMIGRVESTALDPLDVLYTKEKWRREGLIH